MFGRKPAASVPGRALIVPAGTYTRTVDGRNNLASQFHATAFIPMKAVSAADGLPVDERIVELEWSIPNWMLYLFHDAGTNAPGAERLPDRVHVDVAISLTTRQPIALDLERAEAELEPHREAAVARWKMTDAPLATARQWMSAPKRLRSGIADLKSTWSDAVAGMSSPANGAGPRQAVKDQDIEPMRRQASVLAFHYEAHRDQWQAARNTALMALPMQAQQVVGGILHPVDFEVAVMRAHESKTISDEEAASFRQQAGLD